MIKEFKNEYRWLSNFASVKIILEGVEYSSIEHAYMSAKSDDVEWKNLCSNPKSSPVDIKRKSRSITLKDNWDAIKLEVMSECIRQKFYQEPYRTKLLETGSEYIQEGNMWNDKFWGVCLKTNKGENNLGKLIMEVRTDLQLLDAYLLGFKDELREELDYSKFERPLLVRAYTFGAMDAIVGDENSRIDDLTEEEILYSIKRWL